MADDEFENENFRRWAANVKGLLDSGEDPLAIWAGRTHELGMRFFAGLRMNDIHKDWVERWPSLRSRWERERPHVAIGRDVPPRYRSRNARPGQPSDGFTCAFDFAVDEVREHKLALVGELCAGYDIDGLEMDFLSHPIYFKAGRDREGAPLLTDFMRRARALADKAAADKGAERPTGGPGESGESRDSLTSPGNRKLTLVARVPASVEACEASASTCAHLDRGGARRRGGAGDPGLPRHEPRHPRPRGDRGRRSLRDLRRAVGSVCAPLPGTQRPAGLRRDAAGRGAAALARRGIGHPPVQLRLPRHPGGIQHHNTEEEVGLEEVPLFSPPEFQALTEIGDSGLIEFRDKQYLVTHDMEHRTPDEGGEGAASGGAGSRRRRGRDRSENRRRRQRRAAAGNGSGGDPAHRADRVPRRGGPAAGGGERSAPEGGGRRLPGRLRRSAGKGGPTGCASCLRNGTPGRMGRCVSKGWRCWSPIAGPTEGGSANAAGGIVA